MAKRVLGNDPFANDSEKKPRASKRPPAGKPAKKARKSTAPEADTSASEELPLHVPPAPPIPSELANALPEDAPAETNEEDLLGAESAVASVPVGPPDADGTADSELQGPPSNPPASAEKEPVEAELRSIEAEIDALLSRVRSRPDANKALELVAERLRTTLAPEEETPAKEPATATPSQAPREDSEFDVARELTTSEYYHRQWGRVALRDRSQEGDEFGFDPRVRDRWQPSLDFLYDRWWRIETESIDRIPSQGPVILCANHSGAVPYDGAMLAAAVRREHPAKREVRWLADDFVFHLPFLGVFVNRIGAVRACQENAERLLRTGHCIGVFPEGAKGLGKPLRERYRLQRFGRGGHIKLALRTGTPIVPVAIVGAEEASPMVLPSGWLAKVLSVPYVPITPPIPLPTRWKISFLDPIPMSGYDADADEDEVLVGRLNEKLRSTIQEEVDRLLRARRSVFR